MVVEHLPVHSLSTFGFVLLLRSIKHTSAVAAGCGDSEQEPCAALFFGSTETQQPSAPPSSWQYCTDSQSAFPTLVSHGNQAILELDPSIPIAQDRARTGRGHQVRV